MRPCGSGGPAAAAQRTSLSIASWMRTSGASTSRSSRTPDAGAASAHARTHGLTTAARASPCLASRRGRQPSPGEPTPPRSAKGANVWASSTGSWQIGTRELLSGGGSSSSSGRDGLVEDTVLVSACGDPYCTEEAAAWTWVMGTRQQQQGQADGEGQPPQQATGVRQEQQEQQTQPAHTPDAVWCGFEVRVPTLDWEAVLTARTDGMRTFLAAKGHQVFTMPQGLQVHVVSDEAGVPGALAALRASMLDPVLAIDLEWTADRRQGESSPVAVVQLASASVAVLLHLAPMGYRLHPGLRELLSDPSVVVVGHSWASADETKAQKSFGFGSQAFGRFLDLQQCAARLGFPRLGLAALVKQVMGMQLSKAQQLSNWGTQRLSTEQVKYAALDVFIAGHIFRCLRLRHSAPTPCAACGQLLGPAAGSPVAGAETAIRCCGKDFGRLSHYRLHKQASHPERPVEYDSCHACGKVVRVPEGGAGGGPGSSSDDHA
ncbi:hypothetical protein FOA52_013411 [Chlamydomonas sp. UWO 241]|nr:hypothetical protein FOA52_013411 [Chlamydomonas sp. UWO 241]